jgi:hypothetical protein
MNTRDWFEKIIDAHGGRERWRNVEVIEASLSSGGFAFAAHGQGSALRNLKAAVHPHARRVVLRDFYRPGWSGVWTPTHVQIRDASETPVMQRDDPRPQFARLVKNVHWDKLDILYFAGYALWNYLSFPFVLELPGVTLSEPEAKQGGDARRLVATFDASVPTHSAVQTFHFDAAHHLTRHDYTADVIGRWATAANCCLASQQVGGLTFYTRRKVFPCMRGRFVLPAPTLVWIEIDDLRLLP